MEQPAKKPSRVLKVLSRIVLVVLIAFAVYSLLGFLAIPPLLKHYMLKGLSEHTRRQASVEEISFNPYKLTLTLSGFSLMDASGGEPLLSLDRLFLRLHTSSLLKMGLVIDELKMERPHFRAIYKKDGTFNFSDLMGEKKEERRETFKAVGVSIRNLEISEGTVDFTDGRAGARHRIGGIKVHIPHISMFPEDLDKELEPRLAATVNGAVFCLWGSVRPFQEHPDSSLSFSLEGVDLPGYAAYLPFQKDWKLFRGRADVKGSLSYGSGENRKAPLLLDGELSLSGLETRDREGKPLFSIPSLSVVMKPSPVLSNGIFLGKVLIQSPEVYAKRKADGTLNLLALVPAGEPGAPPGPGAAQDHLQVRLERLDVKGGKVRFADETLSVPFETVLDKLNLAVTGLSNEPANKSPFDLSFETEAGEEGGVKGSLCLTPFSADGQAVLRKVPIQKYRPYFENSLPFHLEGGVLDLSSGFSYAAADGANPGPCSLSGLTLSLADVALKKRGEAEPFLSVPALSLLETSIDLPARRIAIGRFLSERGTLKLSRSPEGVLNLAALLPAPGPKPTEESASIADSPPDAGWGVTLGTAELDGYAIHFQDRTPAGGPVDVSLEPLKLTAQDLSTAKGSELKIALQSGLPAKGSLSARGTLVIDPLDAKLDLDLKDLGLLPLQPYWSDRLKLTLRRGRVSTAGNLTLQKTGPEGLKARFRGETTLSGFSLVDKQSGEDFLKCRSLFMGGMNLSLNPGLVAVDQVALTDFYSRIAIDSKGSINLQDLVVKQESPAWEPPGVAREEKAKGVPGEVPLTSVQVKNITLQGGKVSFSDRYIKPPVSAELSDVGGRISGLSSDEGTLADVRVSGRLANRAPLNITGKMNPFRKDTYVDLGAEFKNVDLSPMSPYAGKYIGYTIEKGKLSLELKYLLMERKLESQNRIFLDQFTLGEPVESPQATQLPVALAVSLLKNRNGEIELNLPVKGNLDDPQFSVGQVILKMLGNLLEKALTAPFSLLASVFGGGEELSHLEFPPGAAEVPPEAEEHLARLTRILHERPGLRLEIEGHAEPKTEEEALRNLRFMGKLKVQKQREMRSEGSRRVPLEQIRIEPEEYEKVLAKAFQAETFPKPRGEGGDLKALPPGEMEKLMLNHIQLTEEDFQTLAQRRAEAVRDHMVQQGQVEGERIFLVTPKTLAPEKKKDVKDSRVDFRLR